MHGIPSYVIFAPEAPMTSIARNGGNGAFYYKITGNLSIEGFKELAGFGEGVEDGEAFLPDFLCHRHEVRYHDRLHPCRLSRQNAVGAVFKDKAVLRRCPQFLCSQKENVRRRFSPAMASDRRPCDGTSGPCRRRGPVSCPGHGLRQGSGFQRAVVCAAQSLLYTRQSRRGIR